MRKHSYKELCINALKKNKYRVTSQRIAVVEALENCKEALSAPDIFELISKQNSEKKLDRVSVYRVLDTLLDLELVHKVPPSGNFIACTHSNCSHKYHVLLYCRSCEKTKETDINYEKVNPLLTTLSETFNFKPNSHALQIEGTCDKCSKD